LAKGQGKTEKGMIFYSDEYLQIRHFPGDLDNLLTAIRAKIDAPDAQANDHPSV